MRSVNLPRLRAVGAPAGAGPGFDAAFRPAADQGKPGPAGTEIPVGRRLLPGLFARANSGNGAAGVLVWRRVSLFFVLFEGAPRSFAGQRARPDRAEKTG